MTETHVISRWVALVAISLAMLAIGSQVQTDSVTAQADYEPGRVRARLISQVRVADLDPITLPDGTTFTPYLKRVTVTLDLNDLVAERARVLKETEARLTAHGVKDSDAGKSVLDTLTANFDQAAAASVSENCGFLVVQRFPDVGVGRASHGSICDESDPVSTHFWGWSGQVYSGLQAAGWSSDYCGPYTQPQQYLWMESGSGAYGFYTNYSGWDKGTCTGTRNHVRLWEFVTSVGGGTYFSVGTAHREVWDWGDFTHHVVSNGWHLGRDAIMADHPAAGGYYYWGNWGWWGSGGYFNGSIGELGCYSPYGC
jgi:hypothetical protein